jgi:hypothetical protein
MTIKKESERLVRRFTNFLNYDSISDERWHDPSPANKERHLRVLKDAKMLAKIAMEEIKQILIDYSELISINDCSFYTQEEREDCVNRFLDGEL